MEHHNAVTSDLTMTNSNSNNKSHHHHHHNRRKRRTSKQQQPVVSLSSPKKSQVKSVSIIDRNTNQENLPLNEQKLSMKKPLSWRKKWVKWFSICGSDRSIYVKPNPIIISIEKNTRTKSENDLSKRGSIDQDEKKNLSTLAINPSNSNGNQEENLSKTFSHQHHHHQSIDKVNNSNSVIYRDTSRRYSNPYFSSTRYGAGQHQSRTSTAALPSTVKTTQHTYQKHQAQQLSRSADRLNSKSTRRELRYEEHNDYISPLQPLNSIQCHPTIDHYARTLNQSSYFYSAHRRSQIEVYQLSSTNNHSILPRPYSTNIPLSHSTTFSSIPITFNNHNTMSQSSSDKNTYGKLSECHSPLIPVENSSIKAPRRIESNYSQFPVLSSTQQEPVYANTQSLYDNIAYPTSSTISKNVNQSDQDKKSCASQTQLTWTMATFSSFVDLENPSVIIQQPDSSTLYSIVQHHHHQELPPSASPATIEHIKRMSPNLQYIDDSNSPSHYQHPQTSTSSKVVMVEKRDGSFQTLLTIAPSQDIDSTKQIQLHELTPSPMSTGSSSTTDHHRHHSHHRHRRHKSRNNTSRNNVSTRDVGLQVNIQTVKKITFSSQKSDESSITTSTPSPATIITTRDVKNVQTNTEPLITKHDRGTSYEKNLHMITSSSQTQDSTINFDRQTKAAQTATKSLRDQSIETNNQGLFVCDLSSFLKNGIEDISTPLTTIKQKS